MMCSFYILVGDFVYQNKILAISKQISLWFSFMKKIKPIPVNVKNKILENCSFTSLLVFKLLNILEDHRLGSFGRVGNVERHFTFWKKYLT